MAVTTPVALTVATVGVALLQTPDAVELESAVVEPTQTVVVPVMFATTGRALIITDTWALILHPFSLATV